MLWILKHSKTRAEAEKQQFLFYSWNLHWTISELSARARPHVQGVNNISYFSLDLRGSGDSTWKCFVDCEASADFSGDDNWTFVSGWTAPLSFIQSVWVWWDLIDDALTAMMMMSLIDVQPACLLTHWTLNSSWTQWSSDASGWQNRAVITTICWSESKTQLLTVRRSL